jgi:hypothetical protein
MAAALIRNSPPHPISSSTSSVQMPAAIANASASAMLFPCWMILRHANLAVYVNTEDRI